MYLPDKYDGQFRLLNLNSLKNAYISQGHSFEIDGTSFDKGSDFTLYYYSPTGGTARLVDKPGTNYYQNTQTNSYSAESPASPDKQAGPLEQYYRIGTTTYDNYSSNFSKCHIYVEAGTVVVKYKITQTLSNCTSDFTKTEVESGTAVTINLTPNSGYHFVDGDVTASAGTVTINSDGSASITITVNNDLTITASATALKVYDVTCSLSGCTTDAPTTLTEGETFTITLTADANYCFVSDDIVASYGTVKISSDMKTATVSGTANADLKIVVTASGVHFRLTQNLTMCSSDTESGTAKLEYGKQYTITLTASSTGNYKFADLPKVSYGIVSLSDDATTATITFTCKGAMTITATAVFYFKFKYNVLNNAACSLVDGAELPSGKEVTVTVTAKNKFIFQDDKVPTISIVSTVYGTQTLDFTLAGDKLSATITFTPEYKAGGSFIALDAEAVTAIVSDDILLSQLGFVAVHMLTTQQALDLAKYIFVEQNMQYADSILKYYISYVYPDLADGERQIWLRYQNTSVSSAYTNNTITTVDLGKVSIVGKTSSQLDFESDIEVYLPFIGYEKLSTEKYMNKTLHIVYRCNMLSGACVASLYADDLLTDTFDGEFIVDIPYQFRDIIAAKGEYNDHSNAGLSSFVAFVSVTNKTLAVSDTDGYHAGDMYRRDKIKTFSGLTKFEDINLICNCSSIAYDEIIDKLSQGVLL